MLLRNHIALWDVIESCTIIGSSDSSIEDVKVNDVAGLIRKTNIKKIYLNGNKAYDLYQKYLRNETGVEGIKLPSTSPANAACNYAKLRESWNTILEDLK